MMCQDCEEAKAFFLAYLGKPGEGPPPSDPARTEVPGSHSQNGDARRSASNSAGVSRTEAAARFVCDGPGSE